MWEKKQNILKYWRKYCENDNINIIKYLHQEVELTKEDFQ